MQVGRLEEHENPELCVCACLKEKALLGLHNLIPSTPTALLGETGEVCVCQAFLSTISAFFWPPALTGHQEKRFLRFHGR